MTLENFYARLKLILPATQYDAVRANLGQVDWVSARINTLKTDYESVLAQLTEAKFDIQLCDFYPAAFSIPVEQREQLVHSEWVNQGLIYLQNLSSMYAALVLNPQPGEEVLDLTAAPGSKTSLLAALMQNQGRIAAVEKSKPRFFKLKDNLNKLGVTCADAYLKDGIKVGHQCRERFARVLLDAPCSSEARIDPQKPASYQYWSENKIKQMARMQWQLLHSAWLAVKRGGIIVYSTCTFAPEENEFIIAKLLTRYPDQVTLLDIAPSFNNWLPGLTAWHKQSFPEIITKTRRILPDKMMSGFFIGCLLKK